MDNFLLKRLVKENKLEDFEKKDLLRWVDTYKIEKAKEKGYKIVRDKNGNPVEVKRVILMIKEDKKVIKKQLKKSNKVKKESE